MLLELRQALVFIPGLPHVVAHSRRLPSAPTAAQSVGADELRECCAGLALRSPPLRAKQAKAKAKGKRAKQAKADESLPLFGAKPLARRPAQSRAKPRCGTCRTIPTPSSRVTCGIPLVTFHSCYGIRISTPIH